MPPLGAPAEPFWPGLAPALARLERLALDAARLEAQDELPRLQYALHVAHERAQARDPDCELALALALARDATAEVADAVARAGPEAAEPLLWEWRGALFAVRLAGARRAGEQAPEPLLRRPIAATALVAAGAGVVLGGALAELWPVWSVGLALVAASVALSHRRP